MGGGPASADVVRSSCILTFPEESLAEPVPVDAWYLHAVGRTFLRRLARDRVGDDMRIALVMQPVTGGDDTNDSDDSESDDDDSESKCSIACSTNDATTAAAYDDSAARLHRRRRRRHDQQQPPAAPKRYISVSSDAILRQALEETFEHPEKVLVLHVIALAKVADATTIHVRPEIHPNVSPEPVAPLGLVFPTLEIENSVTRVPAATDSLLAMSQSFALSKSVYVPPVKSVDSMPLSHSVTCVEEREYTWRGSSSQSQQQQQQTPSSLLTVSASEPPQKHTALLPVATQVDRDDTHADASAIPVARVVDDALSSASTQSSTSSSTESDYVMLELQTGAGLGDLSGSRQTYFLASTWHVQADAMSASMQRSTSAVAPPVTAAAVPTTTTATSWGWQQASRSSELQEQQDDDRSVAVAAVGLDDSFVVLERRAM